jgi:hypothetical protein
LPPTRSAYSIHLVIRRVGKTKRMAVRATSVAVVVVDRNC